MRLRFTIRDVFWMTLVVVLGVGWWIDHHRPPRFEVFDSAPGIIMGKYRTLIDNQTGDTWIERDSSWISTSQPVAPINYNGGPAGGGGAGGNR